MKHAKRRACKKNPRIKMAINFNYEHIHYSRTFAAFCFVPVFDNNELNVKRKQIHFYQCCTYVKSLTQK